jgi:hypothetical protein
LFMAWIMWSRAHSSFRGLWWTRKRIPAENRGFALEVLEDRLAPATFTLVALTDVTPSDTFTSGSLQHNLDLVNPDASPGPLGARAHQLRTQSGGSGTEGYREEILSASLVITPAAATVPNAIPAEMPTGIEQQPDGGHALQQTPDEVQHLPQQAESVAPLKAEEPTAAPAREEESLSLKRRTDNQKTVTAAKDQAEQVSDRVFTCPEQCTRAERMDSFHQDGQLFLVATALLAGDGSGCGRKAPQGRRRKMRGKRATRLLLQGR